MEARLEYKTQAIVYFILAIFLVGFSIVYLVQGFLIQFEGRTMNALFFYVVTILFIGASYLTFRKAHHKIHVLAISGG